MTKVDVSHITTQYTILQYNFDESSMTMCEQITKTRPTLLTNYTLSGLPPLASLHEHVLSLGPVSRAAFEVNNITIMTNSAYLYQNAIH